MPDINKPMDVPELNLQPPVTGKVRLSEDMQQTLALLATYTDNKRILLPTSQTGVLFVSEPAIKDVIIITTAIVTGLAQGSDIPCTLAMVLGHPDNTDRAWVRPYAECDDTHKWPLDSWDVVIFAIENLNQLYFLCETAEEKVIVAYTR